MNSTTYPDNLGMAGLGRMIKNRPVNGRRNALAANEVAAAATQLGAAPAERVVAGALSPLRHRIILRESFPIWQVLDIEHWLQEKWEVHMGRYNSAVQSEYRLVARAAVVATVLAVLGFTAGLARADYRHHAEAKFMAQAEARLAQGEFRAAVENARRALAYNPKDVPACRVMALAAAQSDSADELTWRQKVADYAPTTENKLNLAITALRCQSAPYPLATRLLDELADTAGNNAAYHNAAANLAVKMRRAYAATFHFAAAVRLDPANEQYAVNYAVYQLGNGSAEEKAGARALLEKAPVDGDHAVAVWRALVADRLAAGQVAEASGFAAKLAANPRSSFPDLLQYAGILQQLKSPAFGDCLQAAKLRAAKDGALMPAMCGWMRANNLLQQNLTWLAELPESAVVRQERELAKTQDFLEAGDWQGMINLAGEKDWNDQDYLRLAMLSHAWDELKQPEMAKMDWDAAVQKAGQRDEATTNLLTLAHDWKLVSEQADLRQRITLQEYE